MLYTIENERLKVEVESRGAELRSIVGKKTGAEYLWQGDPAYWANRATVLFPICGRLEEGRYTYEGKSYEMVLHGIAKLAEFEAERRGGDEIVLTFRSDEETKKVYPFDFVFRVRYALEGGKIAQEYTVENTGKGDLPFSVGGHPGFNVPFGATEGERFDDYYIEFPDARPVRSVVMSDRHFDTGLEVNFPLQGNRFDLSHALFEKKAIFLSGMADSATLRSKKNGRSVTVSYSDMTHLGFWHTAESEAPFVCIEPWHGLPSYDGKIDDFATKHEFIHLAPGETYRTRIGIGIEE